MNRGARPRASEIVALLVAVSASSPLEAGAATATSTASELGAATSTASEDVIELLPPDDATQPAPEGSAVQGLVRRARSTLHFESRLSVDTAFDQVGEHVAELGLGGRIELELELADRVSAYVAPQFYWIAAVTKEGDDRESLLVNMPEARVSWAFGPFDLRVGALVFNWGSSDFVGPNDVLNPLDYRKSLVAALDDTKIPVLAAELVTAVGPFTFRTVIEPFFTPSRFFLTSWDAAVLPPKFFVPAIAGGPSFDVPTAEKLFGRESFDALGDQVLLNERPSVRPDNATLAFRATWGAGDLELSATAVHGWEPLPQISVNPIVARVAAQVLSHQAISVDDAVALLDLLNSGAALFRGTYARRDQVGLDAVYALDPFVLKLDAAYAFSRTSYTQALEPVTTPWLTSVVGLEYSRGEHLQVAVEAATITIIDVPNDVRLTFVEPAAPPPSTTPGGRRTLVLPGLAAMVRYGMLDGDLSLELAGLSTLTRGDIILMPSVRYRLDDVQQLVLGGLLLTGKSDGYAGAYSHDDEVFVEYQWTH